MIVAKFVKVEMVARARLDTDQRTWSLSLTAQGQELAQRMQAVQDEVVLAMTTPYSALDLSLVRERMDQSAQALLEMRKAEKGRT